MYVHLPCYVARKILGALFCPKLDVKVSRSFTKAVTPTAKRWCYCMNMKVLELIWYSVKEGRSLQHILNSWRAKSTFYCIKRVLHIMFRTGVKPH